MKRMVFFVLVLLTGSVFGGKTQTIPLPDSKVFYDFRMNLIEQYDYQPDVISPDRDAIFEAIQAKDYAKTIQLAQAWIDKTPLI